MVLVSLVRMANPDLRARREKWEEMVLLVKMELRENLE